MWFEAHFWRDLGPSGGPRTGILGQIFIEKLSRNHRGIEVRFFFSDFGMDWPPQALWPWPGWPREAPKSTEKLPRNYREIIEG